MHETHDEASDVFQGRAGVRRNRASVRRTLAGAGGALARFRPKIARGFATIHPFRPTLTLAKNETKLIRPATLQENSDALAAIEGFKTPACKPANDKFTIDKLQTAARAVTDLRKIEMQKQDAA